MKYRSVREKLLSREVTLPYLNTGATLADMFTKLVPTDKQHLWFTDTGFLDAQGNTEDRPRRLVKSYSLFFVQFESGHLDCVAVSGAPSPLSAHSV